MAKKLRTLFVLMLVMFTAGCTPGISSSNPPGTTSESSPPISQNSESNQSSEVNPPSESDSNTLPPTIDPSITDPSSSEPISSQPPSSEPSSEGGSTSEEPVLPEPVKIATPLISIERTYVEEGVKKALVSWNGSERSEYYEYMLNGVEVQTINSPSITLQFADTMLVRAISRDGSQFNSDWSLPFTYFGNPAFDSVVYQVPLEGKAYVYFHDSDIAPVQVSKGHSLIKPLNPTREYYLFDAWYTDPHHTIRFDFNKLIVESTTLYARWLRSSVIDNVTFWIKANAKISAAVQTPAIDENSWIFIPLHVDESWADTAVRVFKATVSVHGANSLSPGKLLVMDGWDDLAGRTYWKDENENFLLNTDGLYNVYFSIQTHWKKDNGKYVNIYSERIGENVTYPTQEVETKDKLETPSLNVDHFKKEVYFAPISGANRYEYQINNGEVKETSELVISANPYDFVIVRAISNNSAVASSNWSKPILVHELEFSVETPELNFVNVYFYTGVDSSLTIAKGDSVLKPSDPVKDSYVFVDWYTDITYSTVFDFSVPLLENTIIYPKWEHEEDLLTKEYYEVVDSLDNVHAKFKLQTSNLKFLEFETTLVMPNGNFTFFVRGRFDKNSEVKTYGSYSIASKLTTKLYFSPYNLWDINTERESHLFVPKIDIYFTQPKSWTSAKYYIFNKLPDESTVERSVWPGSDMSFVKVNGYGENIYMVSANVRLYNSLIFNNNATGINQTSTILLDGIVANTQFYTTGATDAKGRLALDTTTFKA